MLHTRKRVETLLDSNEVDSLRDYSVPVVFLGKNFCLAQGDASAFDEGFEGVVEDAILVCFDYKAILDLVHVIVAEESVYATRPFGMGDELLLDLLCILGDGINLEPLRVSLMEIVVCELHDSWFYTKLMFISEKTK